MATIEVGAPGTVEWVLGVHGLQPWRAGYLIECGQISAKRNGAPVDLTVRGASTSLQRGDVLTVADPAPPPPCPKALAQIVAGAFRDYAMVSIPIGDRDTHIPRLRDFYDRRPQTIRLRPANDALKEFVDLLAQDAAVTGPIRDLMLGAHAGVQGAVVARPAASEPANIDYERLEKAVTDRNLVVKPELLQPRPKDAQQRDVPARFVIRGCAVGTALPYLRKFKEALGGSLEVVAPKYEHAVGDYANASAQGLYEFLAYEFILHRPRPLATDQAIVGAFVAEGLFHYDGTPIEARTWQTWIPVGRPPRDHHEHRRYFSRAANRPLTGFAFFTTDTNPFPRNPVMVSLPFDPGTDGARMVALGVHLYKDRLYKETHPWPIYKRLGYESLSDMVHGYTWTFQYNAAAERLVCNGTRTTYTVHQPIVDTGNGTLIHNHFPIRPAGTPTEAFTDRDGRFFAST